jgi:tryptophan 6-halogenase
MSDFIVVGGGTAGCMSALMLKSSYPQKKIKIIESRKIGISGVGEGSTEHWRFFCDHIGITQYDLIKETGATFKLGIMFKGWSHQDYMHNVGAPQSDMYQTYHIVYASLIANKAPKKSLQSDLIWKNRFTDEHLVKNEVPTNQYHFDTHKLNEYLHRLCYQRGIDLIDDELEDTRICENSGNILSVVSTTGYEYNSKFFIDCSGLKRFLISKKLGIKWKSYSEYLILNSAISFATEEMVEYNAWTLAQARNAGWSWHIPVQGRTGNGYVFSDHFISEDEAHQEMQKDFGNVEIVKRFNFDPGRIEKFWYKNCMAAGLSANFVEPLEATSIASTIQQIRCFIAHYPSGDHKTFNTRMNAVFDNLVDYIQAHYLVKKDDTPFWKEIKHNLKLTESLKNNLETWKYRLPQHADCNVPYGMFSSENYICALYGLDWFDVNNIINEYNSYSHLHAACANKIAERELIKNTCATLGHREYIDLILRQKSSSQTSRKSRTSTIKYS